VWKPVEEAGIYVALGPFMLMGIIQKPTLRLYFTFLHFSNNESISNFEGPKNFKIFPLISHLNNKFQDLYLLNQTFKLMNHRNFEKVISLSNCTSLQ
jgi:hypothetical protein